MAQQSMESFPPLPGTEEIPPPPYQLMEQRRYSRGGGYRPRTRHLRPDGWAEYTNRLFLESSPYLLQHAHNPVNWFPWGDEPFELATRLGRPVLVSIGYATCHWCHVMEEESFEDLEIADYLNRNFIAIKVDREERPDIDSVYMNALHAMNGQGGWPLNVWVTPERKPFFGGTYFPPRRGSRGTGFLELLQLIKTSYDRDPARVAQASDRLTSALQGMLAPALSGELPEQESLKRAVATYLERFDAVNGGVVGAPKFPSSLPVRLLLRQYRSEKDVRVLRAAYQTLRAMAAGGIYDQVGGGFHRYATDARWQVPHFEKMLYDNALLAVTYLEGYQLIGDKALARLVLEILNYLKRDLAAPEGGFYAASDADSLTPSGTSEEGYFYTWTLEEMQRELGERRGAVVAACFGMSEPGNFEGRNIPTRYRELAEVAQEQRIGEEQAQAMLDEGREILYRARALRPPPLVDRKVLASWNGLALSAFARAALVLNDADALSEAQRTARFLLERMRVQGKLCHSYQEGSLKGDAFLEDYAFVIAGAIDLYEASGATQWLQQALELTQVVIRDFEDPKQGGFFGTGSGHEKLIAREKPCYDGAVPSGNSVMILNLLRLHLFTERPELLATAKRGLAACSSILAANPTALSELLLAVDFLFDLPRQIALVAPEGQPGKAEALLDRLRGEFLPNRVLARSCAGRELEQASQLIPFLAGKHPEGDEAVAYLCLDRSCLLPTSDPEQFARELKKKGA